MMGGDGLPTKFFARITKQKKLSLFDYSLEMEFAMAYRLKFFTYDFNLEQWKFFNTIEEFDSWYKNNASKIKYLKQFTKYI